MTVSLTRTPTRRMSDREHNAWNAALFYVRRFGPIHGPDEVDDRLARLANSMESQSIRAEQQGRHADATDLVTCAELLDVARSALL